jgi:hypothetical protein
MRDPSATRSHFQLLSSTQSQALQRIRHQAARDFLAISLERTSSDFTRHRTLKLARPVISKYV